MKTIALHYPRYRDQVLGMWLGKFIGGTAGAPVEGFKGVHSFAPAQVMPAALIENDDTDLQLLWLHALEEHGPRLGAEHLAREWQEHVNAPWCEYGYAYRNLTQGMIPPRSGQYNNWFFGENMGCPIRSEIWGAVCPGAPAEAARLAGLDAGLDHFGAAVDAERFLAAIEASLFIESDLHRLIACGLSHVAPGGRFANLIADVLDWQCRFPWRTVRERIVQIYGNPCSLHVLPNIGFTVLALLEGKGDLAATVACAINAGWDTDCTAATAGAVIGGMLGASGLPTDLRAAIPNTYAIGPWMLGFPRSGELDCLTDSTCAMAVRVASELDTGVFIAGVPVNLAPIALVVRPQLARLGRSMPTGRANWRIVGPYWRGWDERCKAEGDHGSGQVISCLPSLAYMTHMQSGIELNQLDLVRLFDLTDDLDGVPVWNRSAEDDRLPLDNLDVADIPGSLYAATRVYCQAEHLVWLMAGSTGPLRIWLNGVEVITSASYQPLTPTTFTVRVCLCAGENRIVVKVGRTSQPYGACLAFKADTGKHWHQEFFDDDLAW